MFQAPTEDLPKLAVLTGQLWLAQLQQTVGPGFQSLRSVDLLQKLIQSQHMLLDGVLGSFAQMLQRFDHPDPQRIEFFQCLLILLGKGLVIPLRVLDPTI